MDDAENRQATSAISTASGIEPPAKPAPAGIDAVTAAAGAMPVIDWNRTSRNPMAFARRPGVVPEAASTATVTAFVVGGFTKADSPGHCLELQGFLLVAICCGKEKTTD